MSAILSKIDEFKTSELSALKEFKENGGKVAGLFNRLFPPSLLYGLGLRPVRHG
jgi:hypothetical protein